MASKHSSDDDNTFVLSLLRHVGAAVALVVVVAAAFWGVGRITGSGTPEVAVEGETDISPTPGSGTDTPSGTDSEPSAAPTGTASGTEQPSETGTAPSAPATSSEPAVTMDPGTITIQVLDADPGADAPSKKVADDLAAAGYDIIASNRASREYTATTVFYTAGNEDAARQVAAAIGASEVDEKPANLSDSVKVHVVVGTDLR